MVDWFQHHKDIKERIDALTMQYIYVVNCDNCKLTNEELLEAMGQALRDKAMKAKGIIADLITEDDIEEHCADMPQFNFSRNGQLSKTYSALEAFNAFRAKSPKKQKTLDQFRQSAPASLAATPTTAAAAATSTTTNSSLKRSSSTAITATNNTNDNDDDKAMRATSTTSYAATTSINNADTSAKKSRTTAATPTSSRTTSVTSLSRSSSTKTLLEHFAPQTSIQKEEKNMKIFEEKYKRYLTELTNADFWNGWNNNPDTYNSNPDLITFAKADLREIRNNFNQLIIEVESSNVVSLSAEKTNLLKNCNEVITSLNQLESEFNKIQLEYNQQKNKIFNALKIPANSTLANFLLDEYRKSSNSVVEQNDPFINWINSLTDKQLLENLVRAKEQTEQDETEFDTNFLIAHLHSIMPQHSAAILVAT